MSVRLPKIIKTSLMCVITAFLPINCILADSDSDKDLEYLVKAAYLLKIAQFVYWPVEPSSSADIELRKDGVDLCIYGENFYTKIKHLQYSSEFIQASANISLVNAETLNNTSCHLIFFSAAAYDLVADNYLRNSRLPILTISDKKGFLEHGGIVELIVKYQNIGIAISMYQAEASKIRFNANLLEVADLR